MNILLVNARPSFPQAAELEQLGLGYLASVLEQHHHSCRIWVQPYFGGPDDERILREIEDLSADLVGFSTYYSNTVGTFRLARLVKRRTAARTVLGGPIATAMPGLVRRDDVDFLIRGEGEMALLALVEALSGGADDLTRVPGLVFEDGGRVHAAPLAERIRDLDALPFPKRDVVGSGRWHMPITGNLLPNDRIHCLITSRGCPNACQYCSSERMWQRKWFARSAENVLDELRTLVRDSRKHLVLFLDQDLNVHKRHAMRLFEALAASELNVRWIGQTSVARLDEDLIGAMGRAGCLAIYLGIESGSQDVLGHVDKVHDLDRTSEILRALGRQGIYTICGFLVGTPWDTRETLRQTRRFIKQLPADISYVSYMTPYPGTAVFDLARKQGWIGPDLGLLRPRRIMTPRTRTYELDERELLIEYLRCAVGLYLAPGYWWRGLRTALSYPGRSAMWAVNLASLARYAMQIASYNASKRSSSRLDEEELLQLPLLATSMDLCDESGTTHDD